MAHPLGAELVIADLSEDVAIAHRNEVEQLIGPAIGGESQGALFGDEAIEFEFADSSR